MTDTSMRATVDLSHGSLRIEDMAVETGPAALEGASQVQRVAAQLWNVAVQLWKVTRHMRKMALQLWQLVVQLRAWQRLKGCSTSLDLQQLHMLQVASGLDEGLATVGLCGAYMTSIPCALSCMAVMWTPDF